MIEQGCRDGRFWHLADVQSALMNVRFEANNGHDADVTRCLLMTQSRHPRAQYVDSHRLPTADRAIVGAVMKAMNK